MMKKNEHISFSWDEIVRIDKELEYMVVSLDHLISWYAVSKGEKFDERGFEKELTDFVCNSKIPHRLSFLRYLISIKIDDTEGDDGMTDMERAIENANIQYWEKPGDHVDKIEGYPADMDNT